ncbi:MAG: hypothetical protein GJ671_01920 [Alteromonadaceae bacterium]|nr:hypothetical protein [Alteromonadaceae bacterium]
MKKLLEKSFLLNLSSSFSLLFTAFVIPSLYGFKDFGLYIQQSFIPIVFSGLIELLIVDKVKDKDFNIYGLIIYSFPFYFILFLCALFTNLDFFYAFILFTVISLRNIYFYNNILNLSNKNKLAASEVIFFISGLINFNLEVSIILNVSLCFLLSILPYLRDISFSFRVENVKVKEVKKSLLVFFSRLNEDMFFMFLPYFFSLHRSPEIGASLKVAFSALKVVYKMIPLRYEALVSLKHQEFLNVVNFANFFRLFFISTTFIVLVFFVMDINLLFIDIYSLLIVFPFLYTSNLISPLLFIKSQNSSFFLNLILSVSLVFILVLNSNIYVISAAVSMAYMLYLFICYKKIRVHYASLQ